MDAKYYSAECTAEFYWHGKTYRRGDRIVFENTDLEELRSAAVIGDIKPVAGEIEMAVTEAAENASRNYRRKPR